ncbi:MAG: OmpA family protein [Hydrogenophaga sp.]|uniref:OmpA family protein n=1 Tax=Hydrogenophaga sp. TaxID=1904254 RepID=UPI0027208BBB|nr:OmpA family protein [Hydrogenophaga sp.]MDO9146529.1 OmpA family protein [Hydrogenophaga sp.]MDO9603598.1 OmpA family protein [Hydrogenophaga sp.]
MTHSTRRPALRPTLQLMCVAGLSTFLALPAIAQDTSHYYGGVSVGQSRTQTDAAGLSTGLVPGVGVINSTTDKKDTAYKLFGGYQFNRNIALEGGYFDLGKNSFSSNIVNGTQAGTLAGESKVRGLNLDLVGTLPFTERFSALARVGVQHAWSKSTASGTGAGAGVATSSKRDDSGVKVGLGLQYEVSPAVWIRGEVERYRIKNAVGQRTNVDVATVSLVFPFGRAPVQRVAAAPAYVAPAPVVVTPAPQVVIVTPPAPVVVAAPVPQRVNFSADTLFGFDTANVRPEGRAELDKFSGQLAGTRYDTITVEGHTDRKGSAAYNQALSTERAESVKAYLVNTGKVDPARISAVGKGESMPVTTAADCSDKLPRAQLITCLQPDRRVEVEVTGTR